MAALLAQIIGYLVGLAARVAVIQGVSTWIQGQLQSANLAGMAADITDIKAQVLSPTWGLLKLAEYINNTQGPGGYSIDTVLAAIAALPAGSDIVIPPAGDNAEAVWLYQGGFRDQTGNMLSKLDETNFKLGPRAAYIAPATPWFALYYPTSFID